MNNDEKNFFKVLITAIGVLAILIAVSTYTILNRDVTFFKIAFFVFMIVLLSSISVVGWGCVLIYKILKGRTISTFNYKIIKSFLGIIYPILIIITNFVGIEKDSIRRVYARVNNYLVSSKNIKVSNDELLILLPHCLQESRCKFKITNNIDNCRMCGRCDINDIVNLRNKYNVKAVVATGGTLAREWIVKTNPKCIIAVACERDLTSGINEVKVIPVMGVVNDRPNGPCFNTKVNVQKLEEAIKTFLKEV